MKNIFDDVANLYDEKTKLYDEPIRLNENGKVVVYKNLYTKMIKRIISNCNLVGKEYVLDFGTGTGNLALLLGPSAKKVIGIDISAPMISKAKIKLKKYRLGNVSFCTGDITSDLFKNRFRSKKFDVIISNIVFHNIPNAEKVKVFSSLARMIDKNGKLIFGDIILFFDPKKDANLLNSLLEMKSKVDEKSGLVIQKSYEHPVRIQKLKQYLSKAGFRISKVEKLAPFVGVICAELK